MRSALTRFFQGRVQAANIAQVLFFPHCLFADAERFCQQHLVKHAHIQLTRVARFQQVKLIRKRHADISLVAAFLPATLYGVERIDALHTEILFRAPQERLRVKTVETAHQPMRGQNL